MLSLPVLLPHANPSAILREEQREDSLDSSDFK
jgi:hypothetical protein